jgi:hypothetical protein
MRVQVSHLPAARGLSHARCPHPTGEPTHYYSSMRAGRMFSCVRSRALELMPRHPLPLYYSDRRPPHPWVCWIRASVCVWPRRPPTACTPCDDSTQTSSRRRRYAHQPSSSLSKTHLCMSMPGHRVLVSISLCWVPLCVDNRSTGGRVTSTATASRCRHSEKRPKGEERDQASKYLYSLLMSCRVISSLDWLTSWALCVHRPPPKAGDPEAYRSKESSGSFSGGSSSGGHGGSY